MKNGLGYGRMARRSFSGLAAAALTVAGMAGTASWGQMVKAPRYSGTAPVEAPTPQLNLPAPPPAITPRGTVVENVVARVNDQIISRSDVERAEAQLEQEDAAQNVTGSDALARQRDLLRDLIDQQLLLSKAKELGLNADSEVIRQLDEIRKQNKLASMEDLEAAARQQGVSFEDYKAQLRNRILTQEVVRDEVGRHLQMSQAEENAYYEAHKDQFTVPEQVKLSEILVPLPEDATAAQISQADAKANAIKAQLEQGADFAALAKKDSGGPTAPQGGELGDFKRGALAKVLEDATFSLKSGETTQPIRTRQGYVILKVTGHDHAGVAPLKEVEPQVQEAMYTAQMQPALRAYLTRLREEAFVDVQPGFVDSGASANETKPVFTAYVPPAVKKKKVKQTRRFERGNPKYQQVSAPVGAPASVTPAVAVTASPDTTGTRTLTGSEAAPLIDNKTGLALFPGTRSNKKQTKIRREKVRFGQAPRTALPGGEVQTAEAQAPAPGAAIASGGSAAGTSTGAATPVSPAQTASTGALDANPLDAPAAPEKKTRFSAKSAEAKQRKVKAVSAKQAERIRATPDAATPEELATQKEQAAPLGLAGDTGKKKTKVKRQKGDPKQRLEDKKVEKPQPMAAPAPTANSVLAPTSDTPTGKEKPASNTTTLPSSTTPVQGQPPQAPTTPQQNPTQTTPPPS